MKSKIILFISLIILVIINLVFNNYLIFVDLPIIIFIFSVYDRITFIKIQNTFNNSTKSNLAIQESELELTAFFEKVCVPMCIVDRKGFKFLKVNKSLCDLLGYSEEELLSKSFIDFIHPDDRQSTLDEMANQMKTSRSMNFENRYLCLKDDKFMFDNEQFIEIDSEVVTNPPTTVTTTLPKKVKMQRIKM